MAARSTEMVGRDAELSLLLDAVTHADAGESQVAVVTGEAGIGKTRLVRELVALLPVDTVVAFGHAVPLSTGALPYGVAADVMRSLVREVHVKAVTDVLGARTRHLAPLAPQLGEGADAPVDRLAVFSATQDLLAELAAERLFVLVVEDAHWADEASIDLLMFWARTLVRGRLLSVVTSRDLGVDTTVLERVGELRRLPNATQVEIPLLDPDAIGLQVQLLSPDSTAEALAEIVHLSQGNPLFVEELVAAHGPNLSRDGRLDLTGHLTSVPPEVRQIVELASLEARPVGAVALSEVSGAAPDEVAKAVDIATAVGLFDPVEEDRYRFHHELLRLAAAESMTPSARSKAHRRWARVLGEDASDLGDLVAAADHWEILGPGREGFESRVRAARAGTRQASSVHAFAQWSLALEMLHRDPTVASPEEYQEVLSGLCRKEVDWRTLAAHIHRDMASGPPVTRLIGLWRRLGHQLCSSIVDADDSPPEPELSEAELANMTSELAASPASELAIITAEWLASSYENLRLWDQLDVAVQLLADKCEPLLDQLPKLRIRILEWRHTQAVRATPMQLSRALHLAEQMVALEGPLNLDTDERSHIRNIAAWTLTCCGDLNGAARHAQTSLGLAVAPEASGAAFYYAALHALDLAWETGAWDEALRLSALLKNGVDWIHFHNMGVMTAALVHLHRGHSEAAQAEVSQFLPVRDGRVAGGRTRRLPVFFAAAEGAVERAEGAVDLFLPLLELSDFREQEFHMDLLLMAAGLTWSSQEADEVYNKLVERAAESALDQDTPLDVPFSLTVKAHLARARGDDDSRAWRSAVDSWSRLGAPYRAAENTLSLAQALVQEGDRDGAAHVLGPALETAESLGARPLADGMRSLAARARLRLPGSEMVRHGGTGPLTAREHEVLQLLAEGMTNDQIGLALFMSPRTASVHVSRILVKLGASNRTEVSAIAHRRGLLDSQATRRR